MQSAGLSPPEHIEPGRFYRFPGFGKRNGNTSGWCKLFDDSQGGVFGDYSRNISESWRAERKKPIITREEQVAFAKQIQVAKKQAEEKQRVERATAAEHAKRILQEATGDPAGHPYAIKKGVHLGEHIRRGPWPQRGWPDAILIPIFDESGAVVSVQAISPDGEKDFLADGKKRGGFYPFGEFKGTTSKILTGEGIATVAAAVEATGQLGVVAFDAGNLTPVAEVVRRLAPEAEIIFLEDNDKAGIENSAKAARTVGGYVARTGMNREHADFWDVLDELGEEAAFAAIEDAFTTQQESSAKFTDGFAFVHLSEISIRPPDWLVDGFLESESLALLFGDSGSGKSFVAVDLAACIATGVSWHGRSVKQKPVAYIAGEGRAGLKKRFLAWGRHHGIDTDAAPLFLSTMPARLSDVYIHEVTTAIDAIAAEYGAPGMIIVDTVARNLIGDENSTEDMNDFIRAADALKARFGSALLLVHHTGHADKTRARGAYALTCALDFEFRIERELDGIARMICTKCKDYEPPEPIAFSSRNIDLSDLYGDTGPIPVTSFVLEAADYETPTKTTTAGRGKNQTKALEILKNLLQRHRENLESAGHDPVSARVTVDEWRKESVAAGMIRQRFNEACRSLEESGAVAIENEFVCLLLGNKNGQSERNERNANETSVSFGGGTANENETNPPLGGFVRFVPDSFRSEPDTDKKKIETNPAGNMERMDHEI